MNTALGLITVLLSSHSTYIGPKRTPGDFFDGQAKVAHALHIPVKRAGYTKYVTLPRRAFGTWLYWWARLIGLVMVCRALKWTENGRSEVYAARQKWAKDVGQEAAHHLVFGCPRP